MATYRVREGYGVPTEVDGENVILEGGSTIEIEAEDAAERDHRLEKVEPASAA